MFKPNQRVMVTVHTIQAGEEIDSNDYPATVQSQRGKWVTVELDTPLPSSNGQFQSTKFICKETDVEPLESE